MEFNNVVFSLLNLISVSVVTLEVESFFLSICVSFNAYMFSITYSLCISYIRIYVCVNMYICTYAYMYECVCFSKSLKLSYLKLTSYSKKSEMSINI